MLNPHILPPDYWTQSEEHFKAVNGKLFTTSLITKKPIGIQIFPNCVIWTKVIGSTLPKLFGMTHTLFRNNPLPPPPKPKPKPKPQPRPVTINPSSTIIPDQQSPGYTPASPSPLAFHLQSTLKEADFAQSS